jgi:pimeloyl-ACP methyl ester carboxylesterase/DNA-binding CsgD family transcriptional regulator
MKVPETRYAKSGDVRIAYQVVGQGALDLVLVPGFISNLEVHWEDPGYSHLLQRLARFSRLILFDQRGTGLSDRVDAGAMPSLETRMDDIRAVMDAVGSRRAVLLGASDGAPLSIRFAAAHPERTRALVVYGGYAHFHTGVMPEDALARFLDHAAATWGTGATLKHFAPGLVDDARFTRWWARFERLAASPTAAVTLARMNAQIDVRDVLADVRVPTLVLHRREDARVNIAGGRFVAEGIDGARFVALDGRDHPIWTGDIDPVVDAIEEFLTGKPSAATHRRSLAALLVARLVSPGRLAARLGDARFAERSERFRNGAGAAIVRHGGRAAHGGLDDTLACFDGPAHAVRCALEMRDVADGVGLGLGAAVHVGEIELRGDDVTGLALHVVRSLAAQAGAGEILATALVADLTPGSGLHYTARGEVPVEGLDAPMRVMSVMPEQHLQPVAAVRNLPPRLDALTTREREVLDHVARGLSNAAIAQRLNLSDHTVKRHVANILLKLDLPTRAAAAALTGGRMPEP